MITIEKAIELTVNEFLAGGVEGFAGALVVFLQLTPAQQLQTIKDRLQPIVDEKIVQRDVLIPNAEASVATLQTEIDEIQAFIDA